ANIGGIAGINAGSINESANYGAYIEGNVYIADYVYTDQNGVSKTNIYHGYTGDTTTINQEQNIGGIVGINNAGTVDNVRVIFIKFNKDEVAVCAQQTNIIGVGNVGGIIGKATNTKLQRAYVENFVNDEDEVTFNIIGNNGANVAGLIADINDDPSKDATSAILSFVQADFDVEGCVFYEFGQDLDYSYVYFIGDVLVLKGDISNDKLIAHNHAGTNSYIINNIMHQQGNVYIKIVAEDGLDNIEVIPEENYATAGDTTAIYGYTIQWRQSVKEAVNNNQPYLWYSITDDGEIIVATETLTISPTDLIVNVDKDYFGDDELVDDKYKVYDNSGIYMQYEKTDATDKRIVSTAIVYYV
ncbi:MAG: hypothetical protein IJ371_00760, partial [Clostridia bacterium]|nr:hypothetical protein [Clostridia bacterium]